jgi:HSP20 family protein
MPIVRYNPWTLLKDIQGEVNDLFDRDMLQKGDPSEMATGQWSPHVDIKEEVDKFVIVADLPGVEPKEIQVSMENNIMTIKGERKLERKVKEENYSCMERFSGTFYRRFTLPDHADGEKICAKGKDGVLEIAIPKKERHVPKRINVKVATE